MNLHTRSFPTRRNYAPVMNITQVSALPFIHRPGRRNRKASPSNWHVPQAQDYNVACEIGREYAAHFVQYLKDNPATAGGNLLSTIVADMNLEDDNDNRGYSVGFFSHLEHLLYRHARVTDIFGDVDDVNEYYPTGDFDEENDIA